MNVVNLIKKAWKWKWILRSLPSTLYFNFHYLPFRQALRLPVILYKPQLKAMKGRVVIQGEVKMGMVILGENIVPLYPNSGIMYENNGGTVVFKGECQVGNATSISVGPDALLTFGHKTCASAAMKLVCFKEIEIQDKVRFGWDVTLLDCDFHKLTLLGGGYTNPFRKIEIGENSWLGYGCTVLKGTVIPPFTTVSAKTVLSKKYDIPQYCVIGMDNIVKVKKEGVFRNLDDDSMDDMKM